MRVELPIVSFVSLILVLIPLPLFWRARNHAVLGIIGWLALGNAFHGVNAIVWSGTVVEKYPVWCDITTKLTIGSNTAIPALLLCLCHYLAVVASGKIVSSSAESKRWRTILELSAGVGLPVIQMALHYVVQGHRFNIFEDIGCVPAVYMSIPAIFIVYLPPIVLSFGVLIYAGVALMHFIHRRSEMLTTIRSSRSALTSGAYFRLITVSVTEMILAQSIALWDLISRLERRSLLPWVSWKFVHEDWYIVSQYPRLLLREEEIRDLYLNWYLLPFSSVLFFAFFGCGRSVRAEYVKGWQWLRRRMSRVQPKPQPVLPLSSYSRVDLADSTITVSSLSSLSEPDPELR